MARIMAMTTTSLADAKNRLSELVASAETTHERTVVTKNGRPAAVLMSVDDLESLEETLALLSDREALVDLAESEITARYGLFYAQDEIWDGSHGYSDEESERRLIARMGRAAYDEARARIRADLLASPDAAVRERAALYA
jgi:antitoxin YefM